MSRYRRQLTRPEIARLAEETTELRRELQDLVSSGKDARISRSLSTAGRAGPKQAGTESSSRRSRKR